MTDTYVQNPAKKLLLRRQQSMATHRLHFDTIVKGSMQELKNTFEGIVSATVKDYSLGRDLALEMMMARFASDLQRSVDRFSHQYLDPTWSTFDKNNDGSLQKEEMRSVVSSLLADIDKNLLQMVRGAMEPAAENLLEWIHSEAVGPMGMGNTSGGMGKALDSNVHGRIEAAANKLSQLLCILMSGLRRDSDAISDEIFDTVDIDKDGKVTKREFSDGFAEAFGAVLDFSKITRLMIQERPSLQRSASMETSDSSIFLSAGLVVLAVASVAFLILKRKH